jgi:hypothetical protein
MFSSGTLSKVRYTLCYSPGAKGTFGGTRLSPIVLHSLEFEGEKPVWCNIMSKNEVWESFAEITIPVLDGCSLTDSAEKCYSQFKM